MLAGRKFAIHMYQLLQKVGITALLLRQDTVVSITSVTNHTKPHHFHMMNVFAKLSNNKAMQVVQRELLSVTSFYKDKHHQLARVVN